MNRVSLVTAVDSDEPIKWGLDVSRIAVPTVLLCPAEMAAAFRERGPSADVHLVTVARAERLSIRDKLDALHETCRAEDHPGDGYFWVNAELLYQHLSFEFLYADVLARALRELGAGGAYFQMPGYDPGSFFGGPRHTLEAAYHRCDGNPAQLFETLPGGNSPAPLFRAAFGVNAPVDLNLNLARLIEEPILHVAGDSHVYNCFTPNTAIGCRANVLVRTRDVSAIPVPYAYQFSHHLGGRTMHHAGRPGALLAVAAQCGLKDGDAVVWVFGEIDVRCHILKRHKEDGRPLAEVIDTLARHYIRSILEVRHRHPRTRHVVFAPIPPLDNPHYSSDSLPVFGSIEERIALTRQLRAALAASCARHDIWFLDVAAPFETERGDLRWELSDHFCHIASSYQAPILERLYTALAD